MSHNNVHDKPRLRVAGRSAWASPAAMTWMITRNGFTSFLFCVGGLILFALQGCTTLTEKPLDRRLEARADDAAIEFTAITRLHNDIRSGSRLAFTSYNRRVLITGEVPDSATKVRIANTVAGIENVQGIWNEATITDNNSIKEPIDDSLVASRVRANLVKADPVVASHVKVVVDAGTVFLLGIVNDQEAWDAIQAVRTTTGVRYVVNTMQVVSDAEIQRIEAALRPMAPVITCTVPTPSQSPMIRETW